ncbi:hypothetical protein HDA35_003076 [Micromonospora purpureochromogenes]|uniref:Uncharacterized protein n=1 Tax=Micromonospora purpureochromogenes TaxID=47872 RepID=A0ABX2RL44_9ACTN|nr:hypothetical protein [Micromonospora purpureochromogenes]
MEFLKLRRSYPGLTVRLATESDVRHFEGIESLPIRLLRVVLDSPDRTGFVACSRVVVRQVDDLDDDSWSAGEVLIHAVA